MSQIRDKTIEVPSSVKISFSDYTMTATGPKGINKVILPEFLVFKKEESKIVLSVTSEPIKLRNRKIDVKAIHGTYAKHIKNAIQGSEKLFEKKILLQGTSYTKSKNLGYSFSILPTKSIEIDVKKKYKPIYSIPEGITVEKEDVLESRSKTKIQCMIMKSHDLQKLSQFSSLILSKTMKWNPYTQQGLREQNKPRLFKTMNKKGDKKK